MSLIVWYPLIKDKKNYGIDYSISELYYDNITEMGQGKVGPKSYGRSQKVNNIEYQYSPYLANTKVVSVTFWAKLLDDDVDWPDMIALWTNNGVTEENMRLEYSYYNATNRTKSIHLCNNVGYNMIPHNQEFNTINVGEWYHFALICTGQEIILYVDGKYINKVKQLPDGYFTGHFAVLREAAGYYNDFRIYDHALSELEIKEISQGLMLHYDFEDPYAEPTVNIPHTLGFSNVTKGSDENGDYFIKPQGATWASGLQLGGISIEPDTYYTWSIDVMPTTDAYIMFDPNTVADNYTGNDLARSGWRSNFHNVKIKGNEWTRVSMTVKTKADATNIKEWSVFCPDSTYAEMKVYYKNSLYEQKAYPTPFTETERQPEVVYDSSGYYNNGIIKSESSPNWCSNTSAQGKYCTFYDGKSFIKVNNMTPQYMDAVTVSVWVYCEDWANTTFKISTAIVSEIQQGGFGFKSNKDNNYYFRTYYETTGYPPGIAPSIVTTELSAGWHHFVGVGNKNSNIVYLDGKEYSRIDYNLNERIDCYDNQNNIPLDLYIGAEYDSDTQMFYLNHMYIDDVRVYATELSSEDILSLYQSKAKVDIKGNLHCSQLVETNNNSLTTPLEELPITGDLTDILYKFYSSGSFTFEDGVLKYTFAADNTTHSAGFYISPKTFKKQVNSKYYYKYSYWIRVSKEATYAIGFEQVEHIYKKLEPGKWYHIEGESLADGAHLALVFYNNSLNVEAGDTIEIRDPLLYELGDTPSDYDSSVTNEYQFKTFELNDTIDSNFTSYPISMHKYDADWVKVFHHNTNNGTEWFADENEALYCNTDYKYSILKFLENFRQDDGKFEFLLEYPQDFPNQYNRWKQTANPATTEEDPSAGGPAEGFEEIHLDWKANNFKGLLKSKPQTSTGLIRTFIDGTTNYSNWFYAIGCYNNSETDWHNRMPGPYVKDITDGNETVHEVILYARAKKDSLHNLIIDKYGARWAQVFHHNNKSGTILFTDEEEALHTYSADKFSILDQLEMFRGKDGKFEFLLEYPDDLPNQYNRWKQTDNPATVSEVITDGTTVAASGYEPIHIDWLGGKWGGGLLKSYRTDTLVSFIDGNIGHSNWHYSIGAYTTWGHGSTPGITGIPGPDISTLTKAIVGSTDLYVRIDNLENFKSDRFKIYSREIDTHEVIEI